MNYLKSTKNEKVKDIFIAYFVSFIVFMLVVAFIMFQENGYQTSGFILNYFHPISPSPVINFVKISVSDINMPLTLEQKNFLEKYHFLLLNNMGNYVGIFLNVLKMNNIDVTVFRNCLVVLQHIAQLVRDEFDYKALFKVSFSEADILSYYKKADELIKFLEEKCSNFHNNIVGNNVDVEKSFLRYNYERVMHFFYGISSDVSPYVRTKIRLFIAVYIDFPPIDEFVTKNSELIAREKTLRDAIFEMSELYVKKLLSLSTRIDIDNLNRSVLNCTTTQELKNLFQDSK